MPLRIFPVFRDEEELPAYSDLSAAVIAALNRSLNLVVLCSPKACESRFVDAEIRHYKSRNGAERVFAVILDSGEGGNAPEAYLPLPLRRKVSQKGEVSEEPEHHGQFDFRNEGGEQGWTSREAHRRHLLQMGMDGADAEIESTARAAKLESTKLRLIAALLAVDELVLRGACERREASKAQSRRRQTKAWLAGLAIAGSSLAIALVQGTQDGAAAAAATEAARRQTAVAKRLSKESVAAHEEITAVQAQSAYVEGLRLAAGNPAGAVAEFERGAKLGHLPSQAQLGRLLVSGAAGKDRAAEGWALVESAARKGDAPSMALVGSRWAETASDPAKQAEGLAWLRRGAGQGDELCRLELARLLSPTRPQEACEILENAARAGSSEAAWRLSQMSGGALDAAARLSWLLQAAKADHTNAQREIGIALCEGKGINRDLPAGIAWLRKAAEKSDEIALKKIVAIYDDDSNIPSKTWDALRWHIDGARAGSPLSMVRAAKAIRGAEAQPVTKAEAMGWLRRAAKAGVTEACLELGEWTLLSAKNTADLEAALAEFEAGAKSGHAACMVMSAKIHLAIEKRTGPDGVRGEAALAWLRKAESLGHWEGRRLLAGLIRSSAPTQAATLLRRGIESKDPEAARELGSWMASEAASSSERAEALRVFHQGAMLGSQACLRGMATLLIYRKTVPATEDQRLAMLADMRKAGSAGDAAMMAAAGWLCAGHNDAEAHAWIKLAWDRGMRATECERALRALEKRMTPAEISAAEAKRAELGQKIRPSAKSGPRPAAAPQ